MNIAIANVWLFGRTGTEIVTLELARELKRRGNQIFVFASEIGRTAELMEQDGIPVIDDLSRAPFEPQVVHGNHNVVLVQALLHFREAAGIYVCHDASLWQNSPPDMSRIRRFIAVDQHCMERVERELPRVRGQVLKLHNAVDLKAYKQRTPLRDAPANALILTKNRHHIETIETVCKQRGLAVDALGSGAANTIEDLPARLPTYDIVFATARMAIEAMAVGCAVVVCDDRGFAGMVTPDNVECWRDRNFGASILREAVSVQLVNQALEAYDANGSAEVSQYIRHHNSLERAAALYEAVYRAVLSEHLTEPLADERHEVSRILRDWLPHVDGYAPVTKRLNENRQGSNSQLEDDRIISELRALRAICEEQHLQLNEIYHGKDYLAEIDVVSCETMQTARSIFRCDVLVINRGEASWFADKFAQSDHPISMSYHWLDAAGSTVIFGGIRTILTSRLSPGQQIACAMQIEAPAQAGNYTLALDLVHERVRWFKSERTLQIEIVA